MRRLFRQPLMHFVAMGVLLSLVQALLPSEESVAAQMRTIRLSAADLASLRDDWISETGRPPTQEEFDASVDHRIDEEMLLREALRLQLDRRDPVVRTRLLMNMRFALAGDGRGDERLLREARSLGMVESDVVVRHRLVQAMEQRLAGGTRVDDGDVRAYVDAHPERYGAPARYAFRQIFFSSDRRGVEAQSQAWRLLHVLQAAGDTRSSAQDSAGDPFLLGEQFPSWSAAEIRRGFGHAFAREVASAQPGRWFGPVRSVYGWHLVLIDHVVEAQRPDIDVVRAQAARALLDERSRQALRVELSQLRKRYRVELPALITATATADSES